MTPIVAGPPSIVVEPQNPLQPPITTVPEPSTKALLGGALITIALILLLRKPKT